MFSILKSFMKSPDNLVSDSTALSPLHVADTMELIRSSFAAGNLAAAKKGCLAVVDIMPTNAEAWYHLGLIAHQEGRNADALDCLRMATEHDPAWAEARNHYGNALREHGRLDEALAAYQQARSLKSNYASPDYNIGLVLVAQGKIAEAEQSFRKALEINPGFVSALNQLGILLKNRGDLEDSADCYRRALHHNSKSIEVLNNFGVLLIDMKKGQEGIEMCRRAVELAPDRAEVHNSLGYALNFAGFRSEAVTSYRRSLALNPDLVDALSNLGCLLTEERRFDEAGRLLQKALSLQPEFAAAWHGLGLLRKEQGELEEAISCFLKARKVNPGYVKAMNDEAGAYVDFGLIAEAVGTYRSALERDPHFSIARSNMLLAMQYSSHYSAREIFSESRRWGEMLGKEASRQHGNEPDPLRKLHIGYVSPDFRCHSVSFFLKSLFLNHDRTKVNITCYSDVTAADDYTEFFKTSADYWRDTIGVSDDDVAQMVMDDGIDILVDLAGHTGKRLPVFARKPAPLQVTWLGYPDTTGLAAVDYRFADEITDPPGITDEFNAEKIMRLSGGFLCYNPPAEAPEVSPLPSVSSGRITFGSFNTLAKITPDFIGCWSRLLTQIPAARLVLKNRSFRFAAARRRYAELFAANGIAAEQIDLRPWEANTSSHLAVYGEVDIALDCFPYNGTTTTCEALWMGVPVVTLAGNRHVSRVGASILSRVGLGDLVASSVDEYIRIAEILATDRERLVLIRGTLREKMRISSLCDGAAFAANIEESYRRIWLNWCENRKQA